MKDLQECIRRLDLLFDMGEYAHALDASTSLLNALLDYEGELEGGPYRMVLLKRGMSLDALKRFSEALEVYDFLIRADPEDLDAWRYRAYLLSMLDRNEDALEAYDRVLELESVPDVDTHTQRGMVLDALGRQQEAVLSYDQSLSLEPDYENVWEKRGDSLALLGRFDESMTSYRRALDIDPLGAGTWIKLAQLLDRDGQDAESLDAYAKALEACGHLLREGDNAHTWKWRGQASEGLGLSDESKVSMSKAAELFEELGMQEAAEECRREDGKIHEPAWHKTGNGSFMEVPKPINEMSDEELRQFAIEFLTALKKKR